MNLDAIRKSGPALVLGLLAGIVLLGLIITVYRRTSLEDFFTTQSTDVLLFILAAVAATLLMSAYLDKRTLDPAEIKVPREEFTRIASEIAALKAAGRSTAAPGTREQLQAALTELRLSVTSELAHELEARMTEEAQRKLQLEAIRAKFASNIRRLEEECAGLNKRGNLNLAIGSATTFFAACFLGYLVIRAPSHFDNATAVWTHYIPRVSTVVFIEVFAFFFLRLYKNTIQESRYYQNELTSLAALQIALESAFILASPTVTGKVIENISQTNRNSALAISDDQKAAGINYKDLTELLENLGRLAVKAKAGKE